MEYWLVIASILLFTSVLASVASQKLGIPLLVLFIVVGMLAGSEGIGGIYFDDAASARTVGTIALVLILFSGGLDTNWQAMRGVLWPGISLATVGVLVTAGLVGWCAHVIAGCSPLEGFLLGAIVSSTDAAAVFGILRRKGLKLKNRLGPLLELESGTNDPMAVFLTLGITAIMLSPKESVFGLIPDFFIQMGIGLMAGYLLGVVGRWFVNHIWLDFEGLYPAVTLSLAFLSYAGTTIIGGSGFLAVYVTGLTMGTTNFVRRLNLMQFHDGMAWLMQIIMFLTLGLLVFPSKLINVSVESFGIAIFLMFIARPVAVFASLPLSKTLDRNDKIFLSWVGLRGAVPIILATIPLSMGIPNAATIFDIVFYVVLLSAIVQGTSIQSIAKRLGVLVMSGQQMIERRVASKVFEVSLTEESPAAGKHVFELNLPSTVLIVLVIRGDDSYIPRGLTQLLAGDKLLIASPSVLLEDLHERLLGISSAPASDAK